MKRVCAALIFLTVALPGMALAQDYSGLYGGIEGGIGVIKTDGAILSGPVDEVDNTGLIGGVFGFRSPITPNGRIVLGIEGTVDFLTSDSDWRYGGYGIAGYRVGETGLAYLRVGYGKLDGVNTGVDNSLDGLVFGGGYEFGIRDRMSMRLDYRYLNYGGVDIPDNVLDFDGHEITAGLLVNF